VPAFVVKRSGGCWCAASGRLEIPKGDWGAWLTEVESSAQASDQALTRVLLFISEEAPSALLRSQLQRVLEQRKCRIAVLAPKRLARRASLAFRWGGGVDVQVFAARDLERALNYLELEPGTRADVLESLRSVMASIGVVGFADD
jgi:hypothetical protein